MDIGAHGHPCNNACMFVLQYDSFPVAGPVLAPDGVTGGLINIAPDTKAWYGPSDHEGLDRVIAVCSPPRRTHPGT